MIHYLFPNNSETTNEFSSKPDWLLEAMASEYFLRLYRITNVETVPMRTSELGAKIEIGFQVLFLWKRCSEHSLYNSREGISYGQ
jgi:hypothetical protein